MNSLSQLYADLDNWSLRNRETLGFFQEWDFDWSIRPNRGGYTFSLLIREADESHPLASGAGESVEEACENARRRIPEELQRWGWPDEFPVKENHE